MFPFFQKQKDTNTHSEEKEDLDKATWAKQNIAGVPLPPALWNIVMLFDVMGEDNPIQRLREWKKWGKNNKVNNGLLEMLFETKSLSNAHRDKASQLDDPTAVAIMNTIFIRSQSLTLVEKSDLVKYILNRDFLRRKPEEHFKSHESLQEVSKKLVKIYSDTYYEDFSDLSEKVQDHFDNYLIHQLIKEILISKHQENPEEKFVALKNSESTHSNNRQNTIFALKNNLKKIQYAENYLEWVFYKRCIKFFKLLSLPFLVALSMRPICEYSQIDPNKDLGFGYNMLDVAQWCSIIFIGALFMTYITPLSGLDENAVYIHRSGFLRSTVTELTLEIEEEEKKSSLEEQNQARPNMR